MYTSWVKQVRELASYLCYPPHEDMTRSQQKKTLTRICPCSWTFGPKNYGKLVPVVKELPFYGILLQPELRHQLVPRSCGAAITNM